MPTEQPIGIAPKGVHLRKVNAEYSVWVVGVFGLDFTGAQISQYIEQVNREGQEPVLKIDSPGGFVSDSMNVYDYVRVNGLKFYAEGYGQVSSAATMLLMAAGRKRASMAPNAVAVIHTPYGGSDSANDTANESIVAIYAEHTGKPKNDIVKMMEEGDAGRVLSASEMKKNGFIGEVLELQRAAACAMPNDTINTTAMAEETKKIKVNVKLTMAQALAAVATEKGAEVEVDAEQATADAIAAAEAKAKTAEDERDELKKQLDTMNEAAEESTSKVTTLEAEVVISKTLLTEANKAHEVAIAALKAPAAERTVANNLNVKPEELSGKVELTPGQSLAKSVFAQMTPAQRVKYDVDLKRKQAAKA